jgi:hypothetical protein
MKQLTNSLLLALQSFFGHHHGAATIERGFRCAMFCTHNTVALICTEWWPIVSAITIALKTWVLETEELIQLSHV